jgi:hypothetical protein
VWIKTAEVAGPITDPFLDFTGMQAHPLNMQETFGLAGSFTKRATLLRAAIPQRPEKCKVMSYHVPVLSLVVPLSLSGFS